MSLDSPRALVADDEAVLRFALKRQLQELWPQLEVVAQAENGQQALAMGLELQPDVVFLDIQMPGLTGLEVARELLRGGYGGHIVFVTAYDQYAVQAFEREALDYLLKPVAEDRLQRTVERLQGALAERDAPAPDPLQAALQQLLGEAAPAPAREPLKWLRAAHRDEVVLVPVEEVLLFEAGDKYTTVVTEARELLIRTPIKALEEQLDPEQFWRIHRTYLVRVSAIEAARRDDNSRLSVRVRGREQELPVSRSYAHLFKQM